MPPPLRVRRRTRGSAGLCKAATGVKRCNGFFSLYLVLVVAAESECPPWPGLWASPHNEAAALHIRFPDPTARRGWNTPAAPKLRRPIQDSRFGRR